MRAAVLQEPVPGEDMQRVLAREFEDLGVGMRHLGKLAGGEQPAVLPCVVKVTNQGRVRDQVE